MADTTNLPLRIWGSAVLVFASALLAAWLPTTKEAKELWILSVGMAFECAAIVRIVVELDAAAKKYNEPRILEALGLVRRKPRHVELKADMGSYATVTINATVVREAKTLEQRIEFLEGDVRALQGAIADVRLKHDEHTKQVRELEAAQKQALAKAVAEMKAELKDVAVGGIRTDYWWSVLLLGGLVLTNYNEQIAGCF
jgi:hypothetical protein